MRAAVLLCAALLLGGCVIQPRALDDASSAALRVTDVRVEAAQAAAAGARGFDATEEVAEVILREQALAVLGAVNADGTRPVTVDVAVSSIFVPNAASAVIGRSGAAVRGVGQVRDADGVAIGGPFPVIGSGGTRLGGVVGAVVTAGALAQGGERGELARAGQGLGRSLARAIYGIDPARPE